VLDNALSALGNVSAVASTVTDVGAAIAKTAIDVTQIVTPGGYSKGFQSSTLTHKSDVYAGVAFPKQDLSGMLPGDLLNPQIELQATEEQLSNGINHYAAGVRAQQLLSAGFKYIEEIGKTAQQYHKAESSLIKAATLGVKTQTEIINFDIANVEQDINREKLLQTDQKLVQAKISTTHEHRVTEQLRLFYEASERKKDSQIKILDLQNQELMQKYLTDTIQGGNR
jgi:hypothetical protein